MLPKLPSPAEYVEKQSWVDDEQKLMAILEWTDLERLLLLLLIGECAYVMNTVSHQQTTFIT